MNDEVALIHLTPPAAVVVHIRVTLLWVGEGLLQNEGIRTIDKGPTKCVLALILKLV